MIDQEMDKHVIWLMHEDVRTYMESPDIKSPWFPAYSRQQTGGGHTTFFSALAPPDLIPKLLINDGWDLSIGDGAPTIETERGTGGEKRTTYYAHGNRFGIEPIVIFRHFHGIRESVFEIVQEFCLFHNLVAEPSRTRFLYITNQAR